MLRAGVFGAACALIATVPGVWTGTLWDNSETAYGEVAREILRTHDSIVMHLNAEAWYIQPPLFFWCAAFFAKLFGISSFAMRLPSVLANIGMGAMVCMFTARVAGFRAACYSGLVLSTMLMQVVLGRLAIMDAMLDAAMTAAIFSGARAWLYETEADERGGAWIAAWIAAALGFLVKGPVALAIPALIVIPWIFWERRLGRRTMPPLQSWLLGAVAAIAITAPWLGMFIAQTGAHGAGEFFLHYTVGRYLGVIENQTGVWYYYLPVLLLAVFPWTGVVIAALIEAVRNRARYLQVESLHGALVRLSLLWLAVPPLFFSFAQTKLPSYIAIIMPGTALLCALWLEEILPLRRKIAVIPFASVAVFTGILIVALAVFAHENTLTAQFHALWGYAAAFIACLCLGALAAALLTYPRRAAVYAPLVLGLGTVTAMSVVACGAVPAAEQFKPVPPLAAIIRQIRRPGDMVALQGVTGENSLMFYTAPPVVPLDSPNVPPSTPRSDPSLILRYAPRVLLLAPVQRPIPDPTYGRRRRRIAIAGKDALFVIDGPVMEPQSQAR